MYDLYIKKIKKAHEILLSIGIEPIFVGGITSFLYIDKIELGEIRATEDIDCIIDITSKGKYAELEKKLRKNKFKNCVGDNVPICRWEYEDLLLDIMPIDEEVLGFSNQWYGPGAKNSVQVILPRTKTKIKILAIEYFLTTKLVAFFSRGAKDLVFSQDLQDIIYVFDGRKKILEDIEKSNKDVRDYIKKSISKLLSLGQFEQVLYGEFSPELSIRATMIIDKMKSLKR
jgi:hypothetical protein